MAIASFSRRIAACDLAAKLLLLMGTLEETGRVEFVLSMMMVFALLDAMMIDRDRCRDFGWLLSTTNEAALRSQIILARPVGLSRKREAVSYNSYCRGRTYLLVVVYTSLLLAI